MSQSKGASSSKAASTAGSKAKPAAKRKTVAAAKTVETVETLRIIPAPQPASLPEAAFTADDKARSKQALVLAGQIEKALRQDERAIALDPAAVQALMAALCKTYSTHVDMDLRYDAFSTTHPVTPTDVMVTASGLLKAANLAVFELGMWQSWTGR